MSLGSTWSGGGGGICAGWSVLGGGAGLSAIMSSHDDAYGKNSGPDAEEGNRGLQQSCLDPDLRRPRLDHGQLRVVQPQLRELCLCAQVRTKVPDIQRGEFPGEEGCRRQDRRQSEARHGRISEPRADVWRQGDEPAGEADRDASLGVQRIEVAELRCALLPNSARSRSRESIIEACLSGRTRRRGPPTCAHVIGPVGETEPMISTPRPTSRWPRGAGTA